MVKSLVFNHRLDLALRLVDTTNGRNVSGRGVFIQIDGSPVSYGEKPDGLLIFQSLSARTFQMEIISAAFEPVSLAVDLDALDKVLPLLEVHLIPGPKYPGVTDFLTLEGKLAGIEELMAIRVGDNSCMIREFEPRRRMMKIFNPHHLALERVHYALVDPDKNLYEPFQIVRLLDDMTAKIDRVLELPFKNYFPITPIVFGKTTPDGGYCLRVRDDTEEAKWLIRWAKDGQHHFQIIDFRNREHCCLEEGGE